MKPAFASPAEIDARLAAAESADLIKLKPISANLGVEVEGIDLKHTLSAEQVAVVLRPLHRVLLRREHDARNERRRLRRERRQQRGAVGRVPRACTEIYIPRYEYSDR